jgi:2'-5' RNA ligase
VRSRLAAFGDGWRWLPGARPVVVANLHATPHEDIGAALLELGVALDARPCAAHVTLARRAARAEPPPEFAFASLSGFTKFKAPLD